MKKTKQMLSTLLILLTLVFLAGCSKKTGPDARGDKQPGESPVASKAELAKEKPAVETVRLLPVKQDAKWGYIDTKGTLVIASQYDEAKSFSEGLAAVRVGKQWGYIDGAGATKINPQYKFAGEFSDGLAFVLPPGEEKKSDKGGGGLVALTAGSSGRLESKPKSEKDSAGAGGYIDPSGKMVIGPRFHESEKFSEGLALVCLKPKVIRYTNYIDSVTIERGSAMFSIKEKPTVLKSRKIGYVDKGGNLITTSEFDDGKGFHSGVAWVMAGKKWGLLDKTGKSVIEPTFDSAREFNEGLAAVKAGKKWGFVDQTGKLAINVQFDEAGDFSAGLAPAQAGKQWGYVDKTGAVKITPQFAQARKFSEDLAAVKTGKQWGFINPAGQVVINAQFDEAGEFAGGLAKARAGKKDGYIDRSGAFVWPQAKQQ